MEWTNLLSGKRDNWTTGIDMPKVDVKNTISPRVVNTPQVLIGQGCSISGELRLVGEVQILGNVEGEISASDCVTIGESAVIQARIQARAVKVFGRVKGDIECLEHLELHAGASVIGNVTSPSLVIQDGVMFEGFCKMAVSPAALSHTESLEKSGDMGSKKVTHEKRGKAEEDHGGAGIHAGNS